MSPWIFPEHLLAVLSPNAKGCSRRKDCPGSGKEQSLAPAATGQAGHCQPLGAHCPALSLAGCGGGEGESRGGDTRLCSPSGSAAEGLTLLGSQIYCGSRLGEDGSCLLALGPIGAHRKQLGMLATVPHSRQGGFVKGLNQGWGMCGCAERNLGRPGVL